MNRAIGALIWEQIWKNRIVFPVVIFMLGASFVMQWATQNADRNTWWVSFMQVATMIFFLSTILLGIVPFTLSESSGGWRMNSMVTRWFVLPVSTVAMVIVSLAMLVAIFLLILTGWWAIWKTFAPAIERPIFLPIMSAWVAGAALLQALAWAIPRRPSQYWCIAGLLLPVILISSFSSLDTRLWIDHGREAYASCAALVILSTGFGCYAAKRNRCGDWPGELSFGRVMNAFLGLRPQFRNPRSRRSAILGTDSVGQVFSFTITWVLFGGIVVGIFSMMARGSADRWMWNHFGWKTLIFFALHSLPLLAVIWLAIGSVYFGGEPGFGFRTRLSTFRATTPATSGVLAMQRIATPVLAWLAVWLPLFILSIFYNTPHEWKVADNPDRDLYAMMARLMVVSAHFVIGALPLLLLGRLEGFPNMFLCSIVAWAGPFFLCTFAGPEEQIGAGVIASLSVWCGGKVIITAWALTRSLRAGDITWRFAVGLVAGWLAVASILTWGLPLWQKWGASGLIGVVVFLPLARIAACPLAMSMNRHR